jgi:hypothetical protein
MILLPSVVDTIPVLFPDPKIIQMRYSPKTGKILYVEYGLDWFWIPHVRLYTTNGLLVKENAYWPNWCPTYGKQLTYSVGAISSFSDTYWKDGYDGTEALVIPGGRMIAWFN